MADPDYRAFQRLIANEVARERAENDPLKLGGGGGTSGGMEARVARLESDMEHVKKGVDDIRTDLKAMRSDLGTMKVDFGRFDERLKTMPTKGFIFATSAALLASFATLVALITRFIG